MHKDKSNLSNISISVQLLCITKPASLLALMLFVSLFSTYKSEQNLIPLWTLSKLKETGIEIVGYKYSTSGDGKSVCDGFSAIMKRVAHSYIADGHKATTPQELAAAFVSKVAVESVLVYSGTVEKITNFKGSKRQIDKISSYSDFEFTEKGVLVRMASGIGQGKHIELEPMDQKARYKCSIHLPTDNQMVTADHKINPKYCLPSKLTPRLMKFQGETEIQTAESSPGSIDTDDYAEESLEDGGPQDIDIEDTIQMQGSLYVCPTKGCVCVYKSLDRFRQHVRNRMCKIRLRKRSAKGELRYRYEIPNHTVFLDIPNFFSPLQNFFLCNMI